MTDLIQKIGKSIIQHGSENDRIYLMRFAGRAEALIKKLDQICLENKYSKIFAKIPASSAPAFIANNFKIEAFVPRFFKGREDCFFVAKYFSKNRSKISEKELTILQNFPKSKKNSKNINSSPYKIKKIQKGDALKLAELYRKTFKSYPFPIDSKKYLLETIQENVIYFGAWQDDKLIGAASAEIDQDFLNAEMTDFAVAPKFRGNNLALILLARAEKEMKNLGIKTLYTIARLNSFGMNATFLKAGYAFSGTLVNNTNIAGSLESMNVWYKQV
ncbi:putative beta-lysine N-acetyltransferase [Candidatus Gracilibacteria bacterium]|nr:putative beta-lysine N-acetyltransferase [Candidatus Gracilibacteria bacterium]MCF7856426.1 putative beta-lysine N-acetyltransferase [Candidatus Gracilibacteria bacterium]MCF7896299.1 putative beta-lysine N-acetyltransferase [Candidatus Gracilibacteria bacterium]